MRVREGKLNVEEENTFCQIDKEFFQMNNPRSTVAKDCDACGRQQSILIPQWTKNM